MSYVHTSHLIHEKNACVRLTARLNLNYSVRRSVGSHPALVCTLRARSLVQWCVYRILLYIHSARTAAACLGLKTRLRIEYVKEFKNVFLFTIDRDKFQLPSHHTHHSLHHRGPVKLVARHYSRVCVYTQPLKGTSFYSFVRTTCG